MRRSPICETLPPGPVAEFSRDMVETLNEVFSRYETDGVVQVEMNEKGLWLVNPHNGSRQFLGLARLPEAPRPTHAGVCSARH